MFASKIGALILVGITLLLPPGRGMAAEGAETQDAPELTKEASMAIFEERGAGFMV